MQAEENHFQGAQKDFVTLKKNHEIPPQMQVKLEYLLSKILDKAETNIPNISELPDYERNSLDQLNKETGIQLFCNIVNCLSGKDVVLYFRDQKAYIRKDQTFSMWSTCYITCDSNTVFIKKKVDKKPSHQFSIIDLRISKNFKPYKKKVVFGAAYKKKQCYLIGFQLESVCARTHELLRNLIREKVQQKNRLAESSRLSSSRASYEDGIRSLNENISPEKKAMKKEEKKEKKKQQAKKEEKQQIINIENPIEMDEHEQKILQIIREYEMMSEQSYSVVKNEGNYRELVHKKYPNKTKNTIIVDFDNKNEKPSTFLLNIFIHLNQWNPEVEQCTILTKLAENCYLFQLRIKKYSYIAWPRAMVVVAKCLKYQGNSYMVLKSTEEQPPFGDTVKMDLTQLIQVCQNKQKQKMLVTVFSDFDFRGYCSVEDSQHMGLKMMGNLKMLASFYSEKQITGKCNNLFNLSLVKEIPSPTTPIQKLTRPPEMTKIRSASAQYPGDKKQRKISEQSQFDLPDDLGSKSQNSDMNGGEAIEESIPQTSPESFFPEVKDPMNFIMYMMKNDANAETSPELVTLLQSKAHERYYLKHKFDQETHLDINRNEHSIVEPNHYIFQNGDWKLNEDDDAIYCNTAIMDMQKDVIKMIIKQLSSNIMSGKSIMNMSLPVEVFDNRSILQRIAMGFGYFPKLMPIAAQTTDIVEQAKLVTQFIMGIGPLHVNMSKPFNPILGETFECIIGGIPVYMEQIAHHPPISAFYMQAEGVKFYGSFHSHAEMGLNQVHGRNLTPLFIQFQKTKTFYEVKMIEMEIHGIMFGDKRYRPYGKTFIHERTNNIFIEYAAGAEKKKIYQAEGKPKPSYYYGGIFTVTEGFGKKFKECENKKKFNGLKTDDIIQKHVKIVGHWGLDLYFNDQKVRTIDSPIPNKIEYPTFILPSDSNFRTDIIYKRIGDMKTSNAEKQVLENIQRRDRKLRQGKA